MPRSDPFFYFIRDEIREGRSPEELEDRLWKRFGETCAILIADSTGFSRATQQHGISFFLAIITRLRAMARESFERHGAIFWRAYADNLYAEFPAVDAAVDAALELHRRLDEAGILLGEGDPFGICVGIGYGRCLRSEFEGVFGHQVNIASKLGEDTAERGETLLTEAAFRELGDQAGLTAIERRTELSGVHLTCYAVWPAGDSRTQCPGFAGPALP
ncbi:MAG: hypothetical protein KKB20_09165 [Proteobacteria bacterium]|nr:hypothetical protein [Pseudomonadota bacterium]